MAKVGKTRSKSQPQGRKETPYHLSCAQKNMKDVRGKKSSTKSSEKKDWEDATCSVCMEVPHNAILLLCSSYNKGEPDDNREVPELLCPLCRRQVKGWTVVEAARESLNAKKRSCMQDDCSFVGNYRELRRHVKSKHPFSRPREVDPVREEKWKRLECERERNDVISTILSSTPGAMVLGDYVLEPNDHAFYSDEYDSEEEYLEDDFFSMRPFGLGRNSHIFSNIRYNQDRAAVSFNVDHFGLHNVAPAASAAVSGRGIHRLLLGRSRRRRRHRMPNAGR
ncbi:uncharacterized protein LOC130946853 isoform X2 [Arachis stenosperma]|uniref:uncharacterized protein LOC130946853 isoform X2 n=1 Tax=Arachis stenosperma TaxID=217475 RepID=UPI0025AB8F9B|nr:uncharacterized protein LOC130946853 isoform X2 [Arachis stenosperma]